MMKPIKPERDQMPDPNQPRKRSRRPGPVGPSVPARPRVAWRGRLSLYTSRSRMRSCSCITLA